MTKKEKWKPEDGEAALKALIRATVKDAGPIDPGALPHRVKERLRGRIAGDLDLDAYIRDILAETKGRT